MGYWKSNILPKIDKVFKKVTSQKAAAIEACKFFLDSKLGLILNGDFRTQLTKWTPPPSGTIKINFETMAAAARNSAGTILKDKFEVFPGYTDPMMLEFMALRVALPWAKSENWSSIILEVDAQQVINEADRKSFTVAAYKVSTGILASASFFSGIKETAGIL